MVDHIYGRRPSLVPAERPHMFAKEIVMYVDYFEKLVSKCEFSQREIATLREYRENLNAGMTLCLEIANDTPFPDEQLSSIPPCVEQQRERLNTLYAQFEESVSELAA
jgi:hypothetical protein